MQGKLAICSNSFNENYTFTELLWYSHSGGVKSWKIKKLKIKFNKFGGKRHPAFEEVYSKTNRDKQQKW